MHAGFRKVLKREGYAQAASTLQFVAKINAVPLPPDFYTAHRSLARHARRLGSGSR